MGLVTDREAVLDVYREAGGRGWVLPAFNGENATTFEAVFAAAAAFGRERNVPDLPVIVGLTNTYAHRPQTVLYTHTRDWRIGLRLFLDDVAALTGPGSPYAALRVMIHMDHVQWNTDRELLDGDLSRFSSVMFDASTCPLEDNIRRTRAFVEARGREVVVEGACDEIAEASEGTPVALTTPEMAARFQDGTRVDLMVANLGTEHRAGAEDLEYRADAARAIAARVGPRLCLHGASSVRPGQVRGLFGDGIRKVNIWTALERDSAPALLRAMTREAGKVVGMQEAAAMRDEGLLGPSADCSGRSSVTHCATAFRQDIVFRRMRDIVRAFLDLWYV